MVRRAAIIIVAVLFSSLFPAQQMATSVPPRNDLSTGDFNWIATAPVLEPMVVNGENWLSVKDPSIVRYNNRWHLFCTVRGLKRSHAIVMICQASDDSWEPKYRPAYSTTSDITKPDSWSKLTPLFKGKPANINAWLDFWIICDDTKAHLFFTSLNGKMWRAETSLDKFPIGWSTPVLALQGDIFEAGHTYRLKGSNKYLTLIEAQHGHGWRYYKAYLADRLDGNWTPLAAEKDKSFASMLNIKHPAERWTDVISHGELLRAGYDQKLLVDPDSLRFLFQGVTNRARAGKPYGQIPWWLGILKPATKNR